MKKLFFVIAALAAFVSSAFAADSKTAELKNPLTEPQHFETFEVRGRKLPESEVKDFNHENFKLDELNLEMISKADILMRQFDRADRPFMLMKVTWAQWKLLERTGVKLASLMWGAGDISREWLELKFGYVGPILSSIDGVPGFVVKTKKSEWIWSYKREEISAKAGVFWIAIDVEQTEEEAAIREKASPSYKTSF